jgi:hypothetical protein
MRLSEKKQPRSGDLADWNTEKHQFFDRLSAIQVCSSLFKSLFQDRVGQ